MHEQALSPRLRPLLWLAVYLLPAFTIRDPPIEYDTGWHLRSGQWILEHRQIPTTDPFTTVGDDRPWIAYSWLFGVLIDRLYESAGLTGILAWRVLMSLAIVAGIHAMVARRQASMLAQLLIVVGAAIALTSVFLAERPALFTLLFAIATLEAILRILERQPLGPFWLLPLVFVLWANLHIQFVHGLFLIGVASVAKLIDWGRSGNAGTESRKAFGRLLLLGSSCATATLVNPYGIRIYEVVVNYGVNHEIYELFDELKSLRFRSPADWAVLGMFSAAVFAMGRRSDTTLAEILLLVPTTYMSFHSRHELWLVVLVSPAILARWKVSDAAAERLARRDIAIVTCGVGAFVASWLLLADVPRKLDATWESEFPKKATNALLTQKDGPPDGPIFVNIEWGAYVSWRMPSNRVTIDGRAQLHGGPRVKRMHDVVEGTPGWQNDPDLLAATAIVLPRGVPLAELLKLSADYRVFYEDGQAIVFVRK